MSETETATPGQWDARAEAHGLLRDLASNSCGITNHTASCDVITAALQRAHDVGAAGAIEALGAASRSAVERVDMDARAERAELQRLVETARAKLEPAREALAKLLAMAQKPMKSWDAGRCIEAERVEEIAADALEALA